MVSPHLRRSAVALGVGSVGAVIVCLAKDFSPIHFHALFMTVFIMMPLLELAKVVFFLLTEKGKAKRESFIKRHQLLALLMEVTVGLGIVAIQYTKSKEGLPHFSSSHAMWGGVCVVCILIEAILGSSLMYVIPKRSPIRVPVRLFHRFLFFPLFISAFFALGTGWLKKFPEKESDKLFPVRILLCAQLLLVLFVFIIKPLISNGSL